MKVVGSGKAWFAWLFLLMGSIIGLRAAQAETALSAGEVIQKAVLRAQRADPKTGQSGYTYTKVTLSEELDAQGNVKERKERVYEVSYRGGLTHLKLLEVNGHPARGAEVKKMSETHTGFRAWLGLDKSSKGDNRENFLTPELVARFDFTLVGQTAVNGRPAYQIAFQPKNPAPPTRHIVDRLLDRISGVIWIDAEEYEIARADIQLGSEVSLLGGVIGSLKKLAYTMTRTRVADGVWLNTFSSGDFEGRKLIEPLRLKTKARSSNFRPLRLAS